MHKRIPSRVIPYAIVQVYTVQCDFILYTTAFPENKGKFNRYQAMMHKGPNVCLMHCMGLVSLQWNIRYLIVKLVLIICWVFSCKFCSRMNVIVLYRILVNTASGYRLILSGNSCDAWQIIFVGQIMKLLLWVSWEKNPPSHNGLSLERVQVISHFLKWRFCAAIGKYFLWLVFRLPLWFTSQTHVETRFTSINLSLFSFVIIS